MGQPVLPPDIVVARYVAVDVASFARPADATDSDLYRGLRALVYGETDEAERALGAAASAVPDSLRPFVYGRLESLAAQRFDRTGALRYAALQAEARGEAFDPAASKWTVFAARPAPSATVASGSTTVPFDGYRADGALFGPGGGTDVRFFLDSGSPVTILSRTLADRLGLALDSSAGGNVAIPARGINSAVLRTVIDRVRIGAAVLRNVPADVLDTDRPVTDGADLFLGFDALSGLLGGVRYGFADSTLTLYGAGRTPGRGAAPNLLLEAGYALLAYRRTGSRSRASSTRGRRSRTSTPRRGRRPTARQDGQSRTAGASRTPSTSSRSTTTTSAPGSPAQTSTRSRSGSARARRSGRPSG